jgi:hypothetical protein
MEFIQNIFQMLHMLLCCFKRHQDIINIDDHELIQLFMENLVHGGCEQQWNITQPKWHH